MANNSRPCRRIPPKTAEQNVKLIKEKIFTAVKHLSHDNLTELLTLFSPTSPDGET
ncbi:MAG: hypothetical protein ACJAR1_002495 [Rubritalea sp.]